MDPAASTDPPGSSHPVTIRERPTAIIQSHRTEERVMEPAANPTEPSTAAEPRLRTDVASWAAPATRIDVAAIPDGARSLNVAGRRLSGPIQGFGSLWQKTYRVNVGSAATPAEVVETFKAHLPELQPPQNRFFPSVAGVAPGEVVLITARVSGMPISTGVLVLYADDEAFTLMTPEGHPESGMVTFTAHRSGDDTIAQIQSLARANDPIYELGFRLMEVRRPRRPSGAMSWRRSPSGSRSPHRWSSRRSGSTPGCSGARRATCGATPSSAPRCTP